MLIVPKDTIYLEEYDKITKAIDFKGELPAARIISFTYTLTHVTKFKMNGELNYRTFIEFMKAFK